MFGFKSKQQKEFEESLLREKLKRDLLQELREEEERVKQEAEIETKRLAKIEANARENAARELKQSEEPWVEVRAIVPDPKQGAKIELDWNDAFVEYLKQNGINGTTEEAIIQKYIALLLKDMMDTLDEEQANEFE